MPKRKRKIGPGEKFNPEIHTERRTGLPDRRRFQQKGVVGGSGGWFGRTGPHYRRTDAKGKATYAPDERKGPRDRRKKAK